MVLMTWDTLPDDAVLWEDQDIMSHARACLRETNVLVQSNGDQAMPQCGNQCKLVRSPYEGEPDQLSGLCGCMATHQTCSAEFSGGIVKELCDMLGHRKFATAFTGSSAEESAAAGGARRLQKLKDSSLVATAE